MAQCTRLFCNVPGRSTVQKVSRLFTFPTPPPFAWPSPSPQPNSSRTSRFPRWWTHRWNTIHSPTASPVVWLVPLRPVSPPLLTSWRHSFKPVVWRKTRRSGQPGVSWTQQPSLSASLAGVVSCVVLVLGSFLRCPARLFAGKLPPTGFWITIWC